MLEGSPSVSHWGHWEGLGGPWESSTQRGGGATNGSHCEQTEGGVTKTQPSDLIGQKTETSKGAWPGGRCEGGMGAGPRKNRDFGRISCLLIKDIGIFSLSYLHFFPMEIEIIGNWNWFIGNWDNWNPKGGFQDIKFNF